MELTISPNKAAYVRGGEHAGKHFLQLGTGEDALELKTAAQDFTRRVLLTFDLSQLKTANFARVFFRPFYPCITGADPMHFDLLAVKDTWDETCVTWKTTPELGEPIFTNGLVAETAEADLTDAVRRALDNGDSVLSFCMVINHLCTGADRAVLDAKKTVLVVTDEAREAYLPTLIEDDPDLTDTQRALLAYLPRTWQFRVKQIEAARKGRFLITVQTDTHSFNREDTLYGNNAKAASVFLGADLTVNLGDIIRGYKYDDDNTENLRACMDDLTRRYIEGNTSPVLMAIGNHDHNGMWCKLNEVDDLITKKEHFERVQQPLHAHNGAAMVTDQGNVNGDSLYSYMDFPNHNIRVILVDSTDDGENFNSFKVSERQLLWLETEALNTDKQVIIMTHTPFFVEFPGAGNRLNGGDRVMELVEQFIAKDGQFIAYLYGHTHGQSAVTDANGRRHMSFVNGGNNAEAVMIDTQNRVIETVGFGGSASRTVNY